MTADRPGIRAVFDCMVFLQGAARQSGAAGACLVLVELGAIELCLPREVLAEVRDVLTRDRVRQKFTALTDELVERFVAALEREARFILEVPSVFAYERDPKDEPYINLAIAAGADYLVTRDSDLLDLAKPADAHGKRLRHRAPQLQIVDPVTFLVEVRRTLR